MKTRTCGFLALVWGGSPTAMYLRITGQEDVQPNDFESTDGDSLRGRIAGVLDQYPCRWEMFRAALLDNQDSCPERRQRLPGCESDDCYMLHYQDCVVMNNPFTWLFSHDEDADTDHAKAVWALGQKLSPVNDVFMSNRAYALKEKNDRCVAGGFHELHAYDYLLSYWYARRMGVIPAPTGETVERTCIRPGGEDETKDADCCVDSDRNGWGAELSGVPHAMEHGPPRRG